jgi:flavin reductase (DIM6/NTAB) family NADH-FMN oxidoreductase RutF
MQESKKATDLVQAMRLAMRRLAASVVIVSARSSERRYAITLSAVTSLSMEPPSLLVCINRAASIYPILEAGADFCVNLLSGAHRQLSIACSGKEKGEGRFATGNWRDDQATGVPFLDDAPASLICAMDGIHGYGTHGIFIGKVKTIYLQGAADPLVYLDGTYTSVVPVIPEP